eukprot:scaffold22551_cov29-Tisochrysis_lutea.AAC.4
MECGRHSRADSKRALELKNALQIGRSITTRRAFTQPHQISPGTFPPTELTSSPTPTLASRFESQMVSHMPNGTCGRIEAGYLAGEGRVCKRQSNTCCRHRTSRRFSIYTILCGLCIRCGQS